MNPIGALMIVQAIEDERRRVFEGRRHSRSGRDEATDVAPSSNRPSFRQILRFRRLDTARTPG
jgi:hypothetical protein